MSLLQRYGATSRTRSARVYLLLQDWPVANDIIEALAQHQIGEGLLFKILDAAMEAHEQSYGTRDVERLRAFCEGLFDGIGRYRPLRRAGTPRGPCVFAAEHAAPEPRLALMRTLVPAAYWWVLQP